jgi:hypothetical protein
MSHIEPGKSPIRIRRGEDFSFEFEIEVDDIILNLSGASCYCQIRESQARNSDLIAEFTVNLTVGAVSGYLSDVELVLTDTQTAALTHSSGWYDFLVVTATDNDTYYLEGPVTISGSVTVKP